MYICIVELLYSLQLSLRNAKQPMLLRQYEGQNVTKAISPNNANVKCASIVCIAYLYRVKKYFVEFIVLIKNQLVWLFSPRVCQYLYGFREYQFKVLHMQHCPMVSTYLPQ